MEANTGVDGGGVSVSSNSATGMDLGDFAPHTGQTPPYGQPGARPLPRMHYCAYKGDLMGVLQSITEGHSVHEMVTMTNQYNNVVCGITPLFLAAQKGNMKICKLLIENGAHPNQPSYIQGTTDLCTPAQVARLNLHLMVAHYLKKAHAKRKEEDAVLAQEEEQTMPSRRNSHVPETPAQAYMTNLSDLTNWDPKSGNPKLNSKQIEKLMKKNKIDLLTWNPDNDRAVDSNGEMSLKVSESRPVTNLELEGPESQDHRGVLNKFLGGLDLANLDFDKQDPDVQLPSASASARPEDDQ